MVMVVVTVFAMLVTMFVVRGVWCVRVFVLFMLMVATMTMFVRVMMAVLIVFVIATFTVLMVVVVFMREMHIELDAGDALAFVLADVQMEAVEFEFLQLAREFVGVHAEVEQRADEHVAADAAEDVEIESFHLGSFRAP